MGLRTGGEEAPGKRQSNHTLRMKEPTQREDFLNC